MKPAINFSVFLIGFTAIASQIVLIRELLTVFCGNELSIGFILAVWLIGGAVGSYLLGRYSDKVSGKIALFSLCQSALAVLLPFLAVAIRLIKVNLGINPGEIMPPFFIFLSSFVVLAPVCILLGFMFSLGCRIYESKDRAGADTIGKVYMIEAVGSMAGGLIASFVLIRILSSIHILAALSLLNVTCALFLLSKEERKLPAHLLIAGSVFLAVTAAWVFGGWSRIDQYSLKKSWAGYDLVASKNSIYGNIAITRDRAQRSFFDNGLHLYTVPDKVDSEEAVHFALLEHTDPKDVLLVGGGVGGLVEEILKHPVERLDYVELDPMIIEMAEKYLPKVDYIPLEDRRVSIINTDGRFFIKNTDRRYDCIIIDLGDPYTAQVNRYYTAEFFREARSILKKGGVLSFGLTSAENYISRELEDLLASVYITLKTAFSDCIIIPGDTAYFLATDERKLLTYDYNIMMQRARQRKVYLEYVREYYLFSKLSAQRIDYIEKAVAGAKDARINHDFRPISYYYDIIFWSTRFKDSLSSGILKSVNEKFLIYAAATVCAFILLFAAATRPLKRYFSRIALVAVMSAGFTSLAFQVLIMVSFQIVYGYLFYKLGIILTSFMAGLAAGTLVALKIMPALKNDKRVFVYTQCAVTAYPLALAIFSRPVPQFVFILLPIAAGFIGGFQFPLANKICIGKKEAVGRTAGVTYGLDLFGSCLGALFTAAFLLPVLGIPVTCLAISAVNFTILLALIF